MGCCDRPGSSVSRPCWRRCHTCCSTTPHRLPPSWTAAAAEGGWAECEEGRAECWNIGRAREIRCETMCSVSRCSVGKVVDSILRADGQAYHRDLRHHVEEREGAFNLCNSGLDCRSSRKAEDRAGNMDLPGWSLTGGFYLCRCMCNGEECCAFY